MLYSFLFAACNKQVEPEKVADIPALPSPVAEMYAVGKSNPTDGLVMRAVSDLPWDEALSGAAASLGLNDWPNPRLVDAKWAAVISGYPYEVLQVVSGSVPISEYPDGLSRQIRGMIRPGQHVGLSRIRRGTEDVWIGLIGAGGPSLTAFPREIASGVQLKIESPASQWRVLTPDGAVRTGMNPLQLDLNQRGAWWLELSNADGVFVSAPIFIDEKTPPTNWFPDLYAVVGPGEVKDLTLEAINVIRHRHDLPELKVEGALETLSHHPLEQLKTDTWERERGEERLIDAGYGGGPVAQLACMGSEIGSCLDEIAWSLDGRAAILNPNLRSVGVGAYVETKGIALIINMASD